jgi:hypothetical protein
MTKKIGFNTLKLFCSEDFSPQIDADSSPHYELARINRDTTMLCPDKSPLNHLSRNWHCRLWLELEQRINHIAANLRHHVQKQLVTFSFVLD